VKVVLTRNPTTASTCFALNDHVVFPKCQPDRLFTKVRVVQRNGWHTRSRRLCLETVALCDGICADLRNYWTILEWLLIDSFSCAIIDKSLLKNNKDQYCKWFIATEVRNVHISLSLLGFCRVDLKRSYTCFERFPGATYL